MGTTLTAMMFNGRELGLIHVGDSRGYLLRDDAGRGKLIAAGAQRAVDFDWQTVTDQVEQVYDTVTVKGRKVTLA